MKEKMKAIRWVSFALSLVLLLIFPFFANTLAFSPFTNFQTPPPPPRLLYPITDKIILTGKDFLEFKWWNDFGLTDHYEFRLFKGYDMYASDLIHKENLSVRESSIKIKSEVFQDGQVYTWSLMRVAVNEQKSDKSFSSFMIIKK